jgi:putative glutamine amidotransferase
MSRLPLIGIPADRRLYGKHYFHMVGEKYIEAIAQGAHAIPVLVPALGTEIDLPSLLDACDGRTLSLRRTGQQAGNTA